MALQIKKAQRKKVKLKIGMSAPSGGGKTASALILAYGLIKGEHPTWSDEQVWDKIVVIDTENGSGELYSGAKIGTTNIGQYNTISLAPPFDPNVCIESILACKEANMEVCIIDSMSHFWAGQGGLLEKQGNVAKRSGNSYTAWREVTPEYNRMIDTILQTDIHVICTMRAKTEYVQEKDERGKVTVSKKGMQFVGRDGLDFEFSVFMEIDASHQAYVSKDRTSILDGQYFVITPDIGKKLAAWLDGAVASDTPAEVVIERAPIITLDDIFAKTKDLIDELKATGVSREDIGETIVNACGMKNYLKVTDLNVAQKVLGDLSELKEEK